MGETRAEGRSGGLTVSGDAQLAGSYISRRATNSNAPITPKFQVTTCHAAFDITIGWAYWLRCVQTFGQGVYTSVNDSGCQCCPPSDGNCQWGCPR